MKKFIVLSSGGMAFLTEKAARKYAIQYAANYPNSDYLVCEIRATYRGEQPKAKVVVKEVK